MLRLPPRFNRTVTLFPYTTRFRSGETTVELPVHPDAGLYFIGRIRTPRSTRKECPKHGDPENGPVCRVEVDPRWAAALEGVAARSEEHTSELQSLMRISYAVFCLKKKKPQHSTNNNTSTTQ